MRTNKIEEIHESLVNGQRKQMTELITEYGLAISIKKAERKEPIKLSKSERKGLIEIEEQ